MKIAATLGLMLLAVGYLGFRMVEYVTAVESAHRIVMGANQ